MMGFGHHKLRLEYMRCLLLNRIVYSVKNNAAREDKFGLLDKFRSFPLNGLRNFGQQKPPLGLFGKGFG
jgi:hypothetical protein